MVMVGVVVVGTARHCRCAVADVVVVVCGSGWGWALIALRDKTADLCDLLANYSQQDEEVGGLKGGRVEAIVEAAKLREEEGPVAGQHGHAGQGKCRLGHALGGRARNLEFLSERETGSGTEMDAGNMQTLKEMVKRK